MSFNYRYLYYVIILKMRIMLQTVTYSHVGGCGELKPHFVANVTSYLVTFNRILQKLYFIYPI